MELGGEEIASLLRSSGPVVKCVLLRAATEAADGDDGDRKPSAKSSAEVGTSHGNNKNDEDAKRGADDTTSTSTDDGANGDDRPHPLLADLIDEIEVDTTPKKAMVSQILGGPFTFLGQYEEEGIMVMVRRPPGPGDSFDESDDDGGDGDGDGDGDEDEAIPPLNPHRLQPPLHKKVVRGDILLMRVAPGEEDHDDAADDEQDGADDGEEESSAAADEEKESSEQDGDGGGEIGGEQKKEEGDGDNADASTDADAAAAAAAASEAVAATTKSNDDFFLDYTREEYLKFAARTDIPEYEIDDGDEEEEEEEEAAGGSDEDNGSDEEFEMEAPDDDDDAQVGMMNLIFGQILRRFREENGRGPDTRELLEMRSALAERLGVDVPPLDGADWDEKAPKSPGGRKLGCTPPSTGTPKKTAASSEGGNGEDKGDEKLEEEDGKPAAEKGATGGDGMYGDAVKSDVSPVAVAVAVAEATPDGRGEKRSAEPSPENSDDDSAARARKRVKFVPKEEHKVHMVERIVHEHSDDDSSDEDYVEGGTGGAMDAEEEEDEEGADGGDGTCIQEGAKEVETS